MQRQDIYDIFDAGGLLSQCIDNFEFREDQLNMALDVFDCNQAPSIGAIEAGTGIGKSFSYLIPALLCAFENEQDRTVIATSTINLQKQLLEKDIPALFATFDKSCKVALAVGRNNYLCLRRLSEEISANSLFSDDDSTEIGRINLFANQSETGLRTDFPFKLDLNVWSSVCSDGDFCLSSKCPFFSQCFYFKAKKALTDASVIICNHHLLFVDSHTRDQDNLDYSEDCILPPFNRLVIDEAHNIERHATDLFTDDFSSYSLRRQMDFIYDPKFRNHQGIRMLDELVTLCSDKKIYDDIVGQFSLVSSNSDTLNMVLLNKLEYNNKEHVLLTKENAEKAIADSMDAIVSLVENTSRLTAKLTTFVSKLRTDESTKPRVDELLVHIGRITSIISVLKDFINVSEWKDDVHYLEIEKHGQYRYVFFKIAPLQVSDILNKALFSKINTVVCTSATLDLKDDFYFWSSAIGLPVKDKKYIKKIYSSPFDYKNRLMLLTPYDSVSFDRENLENYAMFLCSSIYDAVSSSGGGSLILFTNIKMMEFVYENLKERFAVQNLRCFKQGDKDRYSLLEEFKHDTDSVLFATDSFWEGVDAPGNTLRMVIITKLPFKMPDEPIYKARYAKLEQEGKSGFYCLSLPDATMRLKQGYGRLMRHTSDKGIVLILDSRVINKPYGSMMIGSLPESYHPETSVQYLGQKIESFLF